MDLKSLQIQRQIIENSKSVSEYFKDLTEWEKEINKKDQIIKTHNHRNIKENDTKPETVLSKNENSNVKLKRDKNSIKDYYDTWDKVNVDDIELNDVNSGVLINSSNPSTSNGNMFNKTSNAKPNTNVQIVNNRIINTVASSVEKLKNEANVNFSLGNYMRSIELYMHAINLIGSDKEMSNTEKCDLLIPLYNNKGNCHLKLNNYKQGLIDLNFVLEQDKQNVKGLFRRGMCHFAMNNFILALEDFCKSERLSSDNEKKIIQDFIEQTVGKINTSIKTEKKKIQSFEYSERFRFKRINVDDINELNINEEITEMKNALSGNQGNVQGSINKENRNLNMNSETATKPNKIVLKDEEITKFVYDMSRENLTSSTFKYALRNFKDNAKEKDDYLLVIFILLKLDD